MKDLFSGNTKSGLGYIPKSDEIGKEQFVIGLFQWMLNEGVVWLKKDNGYINDLPNGFRGRDFKKFISKYYPKVGVEVIDEEGQDLQFEVFLKNESVVFNPKKLAELAVSYGGADTLKPTGIYSSPQDLSPNNEKLMELMSKFALKDDLRPAMEGVYFGETEVVSTNGKQLLAIYGKTKEQGNFNPSTLKRITERYPDYQAVILNHPYEVQFDTQDFIDIINKMDKIVPKKQQLRSFLMTIRNTGVCEIFHTTYEEDGETRFTVECDYDGPNISIGFLLETWKNYCKNVLSKYKPAAVIIKFTAPNRMLSVRTYTPFGVSVFVTIPVIIYYEEEFLNFKDEEEVYLSNKQKPKNYHSNLLKVKLLAVKAKHKLALI